MQTVQFQKNKLELIEQIIHCKDNDTIEAIKSFLSKNDDFILSDEHILILEESRENYISGKDNGKSWDEVKNNLLSKRNDKI